MAMTSSVITVACVAFLLSSCSSADMSISTVGVVKSDNRHPLYVQRGDVLQLVCSSSSPPPPAGSNDDDTITWFHNGAPVDPTATTLTPAFRRLGARDAKLTSRLTVQDASELDSGRYMCVRGYRGQLDVNDMDNERGHIDVLVVTGLQRSTSHQMSVSIIDPPDRVLSVRYGQSFTLKCVTGRRRKNNNRRRRRRFASIDLTSVPGSSAGSLLWQHNGVPLTDGSSSTNGQSPEGGSVCGRVVITDAVDVDTGWMTSLMTCRSAGAREAGVYECLDADGVASDNVTVSIDQQSPPSGRTAVEIVQPATRHIAVNNGSHLDIKCKGDMSTTLVWLFNGTTQLLPDAEKGLQITADIDRLGVWRTSLLQLKSVVKSRTGQYTCRNERDVTDSDVITVSVDEQTVVESDDDETNTPTSTPSIVVMRVRSSVTLECGFVAAAGGGGDDGLGGEVYAEWKKEETTLSKSRKYLITQDADKSSLTIVGTDLTDVGQYRCTFRHKDRRKKTVGVLTYNVVTQSCPPLLAPSNGRLGTCTDQVLGSMCTFHCNAGFQSSEPGSKTVCALRKEGNIPYWTRSSPTCTRSNRRDIPSTLSTFLLPVGSNFQLRCADSVMSWTKDGVTLEKGSKYQIENNMLTVRNAVRADVGMYICNIQRDGALIGRNKFNVITRQCPPIVPPPGVLVDKCPDSPVYGDNCTFRCAPGRTLSAGNRLRSCDIKDFDTLYWNGAAPICSVGVTTISQSNPHSRGQGQGQQGQSSSVKSHIPFIPLLSMATWSSVVLLLTHLRWPCSDSWL